MGKYIPLDALVAEITHKIKVLEAFIKNFDGISDKVEKAKNKREALGDVLLSIENSEVKEVDFNFQRFAKEMDAVFAFPSSETKNTEEEPLNWEYAIAKHFFELGLRSTITEEDCKLIWTIGDDIPYMAEEDFYKELLRRYKAQK